MDNRFEPHASGADPSQVLKPLRIVLVTDGKAGHEAQTRGLLAAISRLTPTDSSGSLPLPTGTALCQLLTGRPSDEDAARADLIVCCGRRTHLTALALCRRLGGKLVAIMRPSLPKRCFDLVVAPRHDRITGKNVISTYGAMNQIHRMGTHDSDRGLVLIGGTSRHHAWNDSHLIEQVKVVATNTPSIRWTVTTSRRTPKSTSQGLAELALANLEYIPVEQTGPGWVARKLSESGTAWVSEDSVSMVYEALSAGLAVGLLAVPVRGQDRVTRGMAALADEGRVTRFSDWTPGAALTLGTPLAEADRVAAEVLRRWFPERLKRDT